MARRTILAVDLEAIQMTGEQIRSKRAFAGIAGFVLARKAGISRSRLSLLERGYASPTAGELARISEALDQLVEAQQRIRQAADAAGWPVSEGRLR
jgi:transcriptional regulator with XRE-family HTH domain